jgi:hypothetical protein
VAYCELLCRKVEEGLAAGSLTAAYEFVAKVPEPVLKSFEARYLPTGYQHIARLNVREILTAATFKVLDNPEIPAEGRKTSLDWMVRMSVPPDGIQFDPLGKLDAIRTYLRYLIEGDLIRFVSPRELQDLDDSQLETVTLSLLAEPIRYLNAWGADRQFITEHGWVGEKLGNLVSEWTRRGIPDRVAHALTAWTGMVASKLVEAAGNPRPEDCDLIERRETQKNRIFESYRMLCAAMPDPAEAHFRVLARADASFGRALEKFLITARGIRRLHGSTIVIASA